MSLAVECANLSKSFPAFFGLKELALHPFRRELVPALSGVDLRLAPGQVLGLMGPNGAGKTTLAKLLCTLLTPNEGDALVHGNSASRAPQRVRELVALVTGDERSFYWRLTGRQNIEFFAGIYGLHGRLAKERIALAADTVGVSDILGRRFDSYSTGMRQKLSLARGLLRDVPVLLLDEPTRSLDPDSTEALLSLVRRMAKDEGKTIVFITHRTDEACAACDRVAILNDGRLVFDGPVEEFSSQVRGRDYDLLVRDLRDSTFDRLASLVGPDRVRRTEGGGLRISAASDDPESLSRALDLLVREGASVLDCSRTPSRGLAALIAEEGPDV